MPRQIPSTGRPQLQRYFSQPQLPLIAIDAGSVGARVGSFAIAGRVDVGPAGEDQTVDSGQDGPREGGCTHGRQQQGRAAAARHQVRVAGRQKVGRVRSTGPRRPAPGTW